MIEVVKELESPAMVKNEIPFTGRTYRDEIAAIVNGKDRSKILAIVGPCSSDDPEAVIDYYQRLKPCADEIADVITVVGRVYTCKPRTVSTAEQYFGLVEKPDGADGAIDFAEGIKTARELMVGVANIGFPIADEMLYPENYVYMDDVLSLSVIGARCAEDQFHRQLGSGVDGPLGIKNPTNGSLTIMNQSIMSAQSKQEFIYRGKHVSTPGNTATFGIMRGGTLGPNYHYEDLIKAYELNNRAFNTVVVDCNHSNSGKDWMLQRKIAKEVLFNKFNSERLKYFISGIMIESYIKDGVASMYDDHYGASITDPCLGIDKTIKLLHELAYTMQNNKAILTGAVPTHD